MLQRSDSTRTTSVRRGPGSNRRSRSTRTTPMRWRARLTISDSPSDGQPRDRLRGKGARSGRPGHRPRSRQHMGVLREKPLPHSLRNARTRLSAPPTPDSPSIRILPGFTGRGRSPKIFLGRFEQAISDVQQAMHFEPPRPGDRFVPSISGIGVKLAGSTTTPRSTKSTARSTAVFRPFSVYSDLAAAYAFQGNMDEAKTALAEARRLNPKLTVKWLQSIAPNIPALEGLRKAGLPKGEEKTN